MSEPGTRAAMVRTATGCRTSRRAVVVAVMAVAVGGACSTGGVKPDASAASGQPQGTTSFAQADAARVAKSMAEGYTEGEAVFLALVKVDGKAVDEHRVQITDSLPTGNQR